MIPIILILAALLFWFGVALMKGTVDVLKYEFVGTITIIFFLIHPMLIKTLFQAFSCRYVHGELWLVENLEIT